ncbi:MAG: ParB N-terminal domain-containing protein [Clostridia bacterium]|nr:ParB N-terminal domain-containing protein [Clostridia bacterium]
MAGRFDKRMMKQGLGEGLLSESSRQFAVNEFKVTYIPLDNLVPNRNNEGFSMEDIEELKTSIREVGLEQNLVVVPDGAKFRILTGHRRYIAMKQLFEEGVEKFRTVPCVIKDLGKIDLPLSDRSKELYAIATTNLENRRYTDSDKLKLMEMLSQVYDELKEKGYEKLGKRRDFLAERLGISSAGVQILNFVDHNLAPCFREAFLAEKIPLMVASEIAHMPKDAQNAYRDYLDTNGIISVSVKDVQAFSEQWKKENQPTDLPPEKPYFDSFSIVKDRMEALTEAAAQCESVSGEDAARLKKIQKDIEARVAAAERIMRRYTSKKKK